ncbi:MAG: pteridine reductase [Anaerophaga sp.]|uniref:SDR family oxidoreductase n=1 Tax=Anaerophaga thermohalophila TaxID=177400 RepID=UPI000237CA10|nr:SDR family oxidoreductase [Anaerophaga thermohalophila]MDI3520707.1 pteridine reductase [Anaerophaga sp.]MDK2842662.1 pteridine reductase [Anaerophaga sp.]MDN5292517.1 pteridine reductase [Anaerophaga sp.]
MKQTVLITGSAKRVGAAITRFLAAEGWEVVLHYNHSRDEALGLSKELKENYGDREFPVIQCDLSNIDAVLSLFGRLPEGIDRLHALVNNASTFHSGSIEETSPSFLRKEMAVNFEAPFFLLQSFRNSFNSGCVVNMLDAKITTNEASHAAYLLAKKNLEALTRMAALSFAPGIRVNAVAPGPVLPPSRKSDDYLKHVVDRTPLKRRVDTSDIAASVSFLLNSSSVTGQIIYCDSGLHLL